MIICNKLKILTLFICFFSFVNGSYSQIIVYGDSRSNDEIHKQIVNKIINQNPVAVFNTGDLVFWSQSKANWESFVNITAGLRSKVPYYPVLGNHEKNSKEFNKIFNPVIIGLTNNENWYSVNIQNIVFIVINSNEKLTSDTKQYQWLEKQLDFSQQTKDYTIVLLHHPPFSSGSHAEDPMNMQKDVVPLFEKYDVDAVFSGHNHMYERLYANGINYFITGGGGAPLHKSKHKSPYSQKVNICYNYCKITKNENNLCVTAYNLNDSIIDSINIYPKQ